MDRVIVANRGEIALRIIRACRNLNIQSIAIYTQADSRSLHVLQADQAFHVGDVKSESSYLNQQAILHIAEYTRCEGLHPGYGFLSENAEFALRCEFEGIRFIGPDSETIRCMGDKSRARAEAMKIGVPVIPGSSKSFTNSQEARESADQIGFPILIKARGGGGGRGMRVVHEHAEFERQFNQAAKEAQSAFSDSELYLEKYLTGIRHVEVQILGDCDGNVVSLGERDCSVQRRHQKLVEEAPCFVLSRKMREELLACAVRLGESIGYRGAGTVEFVVSEDLKAFYFIEMNTRIQVEHPVTECLYSIDLVEAQLKIAMGVPVSEILKGRSFIGHAIEFRINAENWKNDFRPSPGQISGWKMPGGAGIRVDTHCYETFSVSPFYDSMIAKLIVHGHDRDHAIQRAKAAICDFQIQGIDSTLGFHLKLLEHESFKTGNISTQWVEQEFLSGI